MYSLIRSSTTRALLTTQAPAFGSAMVIAELFFKFGSFTLECVAFLATWALLERGITLVTRRRQPGVQATD